MPRHVVRGLLPDAVGTTVDVGADADCLNHVSHAVRAQRHGRCDLFGDHPLEEQGERALLLIGQPPSGAQVLNVVVGVEERSGWGIVGCWVGQGVSHK